MKVFVLNANENWICDRFVNEWYQYNSEISTTSPYESDVIWLLSDFRWKCIPFELLKSKKVITSVHHLVPNKFNDYEKLDFLKRDSITDIYHVPCFKTYEQIKDLTSKPIHVIPFWVNETIFKPRLNKEALRKKYLQTVSNDTFVIGSFQRDTEGSDLVSPKLEKGPDLLADYLDSLSKIKDVHVLLAGWRRQYIINRLKKSNIKYTYYELPNQETLLDLYSCLDLYTVAARYEGGPQSIVECAAMNIPIISSDVGLASMILSKESVGNINSFELIPNTEYAFNKVKELFICNCGMNEFRKIINKL